MKTLLYLEIFSPTQLAIVLILLAVGIFGLGMAVGIHLFNIYHRNDGIKINSK